MQPANRDLLQQHSRTLFVSRALHKEFDVLYVQREVTSKGRKGKARLLSQSTLAQK